MAFTIVTWIILGVLTIIVLIDIIPIFKDWLSRIHIGRYNDQDQWNKSISEVGLKWLNHTPKIKVTDNTRLVILDMIKGNYSNGTIQHWQEGALLLGLSEYLDKTNDEKVQIEITKYLKKKFDNNGDWIVKPKHVDGAILAYAIMKLKFIEIDKYKKALDYIWEMIREQIGIDGTIEYRKLMKHYRYVDTVGFVCPFLVSYGKRYNKNECIDLAIKQIKEYEKYGMLNKYNIPCHTYKIDNKVPIGLYGWGRGLGWFAIGLIDTWNELPEDNRYKSLLDETVKLYAKAVMNFQQLKGHWNWTVTLEESRPDSSATATLCWFLLNASKIEDIKKECLSSSEKAINYLMKVTRRSGAVDFSQGDTKGIGVYSMLFNILPFTQGFSIRCINLYLMQKLL